MVRCVKHPFGAAGEQIRRNYRGCETVQPKAAGQMVSGTFCAHFQDGECKPGVSDLFQRETCSVCLIEVEERPTQILYSGLLQWSHNGDAPKGQTFDRAS